MDSTHWELLINNRALDRTAVIPAILVHHKKYHRQLLALKCLRGKKLFERKSTDINNFKKRNGAVSRAIFTARFGFQIELVRLLPWQRKKAKNI